MKSQRPGGKVFAQLHFDELRLNDDDKKGETDDVDVPWGRTLNLITTVIWADHSFIVSLASESDLFNEN